LFLSSEEFTKCKNFDVRILKGEVQQGTIGVDGSFVGRKLQDFDEDANKWYNGQVVNYCATSTSENTSHSYTIRLEESHKVFENVKFLDENFRFI
jgi:hypothetical protein